MNPTTQPTPPPPPPPPQPPPQPHRPSTSCPRHPQEHFTGFCPSCLCERLAVLDPNSTTTTATTARKPPTSSTAAAALRAIFRPSTAAKKPPSSSSSSFFPELRRTKSFSASKNEGFSGIFEPQRKSCDVRVRSTLHSLFNQDNDRKIPNRVEVEATRNFASCSSSTVQVHENRGEEKFEEQEEEEEDDDEIRVLEEPTLPTNVIEEIVGEIVEEPEPEAEQEVEEIEVVVVEEEELKSMKDHIDLDSQAKKGSGGRDLKEIAGSFWSAASVFSKKLQKWRNKQKMKKRRNSATLPVEKPIGRQFRETQSEIADYGFGRRSCDTDPRFSLDAGRMSFDAGRVSFDDARYSFDEPRASWDGYLIGKTFPRMPTMVSVVEDAPVQHEVIRIDAQIPVEDEPMNAINEDESSLPGGSAQTKEYYSDSSSRRRKSFERSSSIRKTAAAVVAEMDELKPVSSVNVNANGNGNAKLTTPDTVDYFHGQKMVLPDRDLRDLNLNSLRDDCLETFEVGFRDTASVIGNGDRKGTSKKSRRWSKAWNIWGLIHRRGGNKDEDEDNRYSSRANGNGVERSLSESWQELRGERNGDARSGAFNRKVFRSNSSVSWRNAQSIGGSFGTLRKNDIQGNGNNGKKARDEFVLERNRSARYSPNNIDNGLLRFYLTPMRGSRRNGTGKGRSNQAHSIARSVLRLY